MNTPVLSTIPTPEAVRIAEIEWCHHLHTKEQISPFGAALREAEIDITYVVRDQRRADLAFDVEVDANNDIVAYRESLQEPPLMQVTVVSDKQKRSDRIGCQRARAALKNEGKTKDQRVCRLSEGEAVKLHLGATLHPKRGVRLTRDEQATLHANKAKTAKYKQRLLMSVA